MVFIILILTLFLIIPIIMAERESKNNMDNKQNAKYVFYYLLSLVSLIFMALSVGLIVFGIIDKTIIDVINNYASNDDGALKFAISAILISAPAYYLISRLIYQGLKKGELNKDSASRRWLTYFILLVSFLIILGVLIGIINVFLSGELAGRFVWKSLTALVISASIFSFYFYDIKREEPDKSSKVIKIFFFASLVLVIAAFIAAWFFIESPKTTRARRLDQALVQNMSSLESYINSYYDKNKKLPANLEELRSDKSVYLDERIFTDSETKKAIVYNKLEDQRFELCADFRTDSLKDANNQPVASYPVQDIYSKEHRAGYQCFPGNLYAAVKAAPVK